MAQPKFLTLLRQLDKKELAAFGKYLKKAHPGEKVALTVFGYVKNFHPELDVDLEHAARKIFGNGANAAQPPRKSLLNSFTDLHAMLKNYLLCEKLTDGSFESEILWISVLRQRNMEAEFGKAVQSLFDRIKAAPRADMFDYLKAFAVHYQSCFDFDQKMHDGLNSLLALDHELEVFYKIFRLKVDCEIMNWQKQGFNKMEIPASGPLPVQPLQILYGRVHDLLSEGGAAGEYLALENGLVEFSDSISKKEMYTFYGYLKNYHTARLREGDETVWEKAHRLDKFALKHGLFLKKNSLMSQNQFFNVVNAAGMVKEYRWAEKFIREQINSVEAEVAYETQKLAQAILLHTKDDFSGMSRKLKAIQDAKTRDFHFVVRYRSLRLIGQFELDTDPEELLADMTNFRVYLNRNSTSGAAAGRAIRVFLGFFKELIIPKKSKDQLETEMDSARPIYFGAWLKKKLESYTPIR